MSYSSHNFPADLFPDLLSRLPAKALLKFKSVSKLWLSIIEDPKFSLIHANRLSDSACQSTSSITQICLSIDYDERQVPKLWKINWSGGIVPLVKEFCPIPDVNLWRLVGSSNGVLCIVCTIDKSSRLILWNPLSRKYQIIPPLPQDSGRQGFGYTYGFGYDKVNDDYNILCFDTDCPRSPALVYSRKMNTWRTIDYGFIMPSSIEVGVLLGGTLHWISDNDLNLISMKDPSLIAFDLAKEEFNSLTIPKYEDAQLSIMRDGRLCMMMDEGSGVRLRLSYGEWVEFRFEPLEPIEPERDVEPKSDVCHESLIPMAYVESPKPVMVMMEWKIQGNNLVFYDVEEQSLIFNRQVGNMNGMNGDELFPYIQTLELYK